MPETAAAPLTGAQRTEHIRRLARFKRLKERAHKIVEGEPRLTPGELRELATIFTQIQGDGDAT
jgi:hypothetical protein